MSTAFVNGSFDLLHCSHLRLLKFAKEQGDRLVVGLNSDASVKAAKGPSRPIIPEEQRMEMLYGFGVDAVITFDEPTPFRVVSMYRPDVLVISSEYGDDCDSCQHVREYGGRVVQAPDCGDITTSGIVEMIKNGVASEATPSE